MKMSKPLEDFGVATGLGCSFRGQALGFGKRGSFLEKIGRGWAQLPSNASPIAALCSTTTMDISGEK